jgi:outer membrane protein assembly factor BamB
MEAFLVKTRRVVTAFLLLGGLAWGDDWPAFRGPNGNGLSSEKKAPTVWAPDRNLVWKVSLPQPGNGSPIVVGDRVFVTCPEDPAGLKRSLHCFDRKDGKPLWVKSVDGKSPGGDFRSYKHDTNFFSSSTPVSDGRVVVAWHDSAGLHAYDLGGKELWSRDLGVFQHKWGHGSSPILHDGKVILNCGPGVNAFVTALDLGTGKTLWKTDEPQDLDPARVAEGFSDKNRKGLVTGSWATPVLATVDGKTQVVVAHATRLVAYDPADGRIVWSCDGNSFDRGDVSYSSPMVAGDVVVTYGGYTGPGFGVRLGGSGDVTKTHRLWHKDDRGNPQSIGTGAFVDGRLYVPKAGANRIDCIDPRTGEALWSERWAGDAFWGSVVQAGGLLYVTDQKGRTAVFRPDPAKLDLVAANELGEKTNATPAVSDGRLFIRTQKSLWCIGDKE